MHFVYNSTYTIMRLQFSMYIIYRSRCTLDRKTPSIKGYLKRYKPFNRSVCRKYRASSAEIHYGLHNFKDILTFCCKR